VNNELEGIGKNAAMVSSKVLSQQLPGGTDENHRKPVRIVNVLLRFKLFSSEIQIKSFPA
jgi:hypothetical protein